MGLARHQQALQLFEEFPWAHLVSFWSEPRKAWVPVSRELIEQWQPGVESVLDVIVERGLPSVRFMGPGPPAQTIEVIYRAGLEENEQMYSETIAWA